MIAELRRHLEGIFALPTAPSAGLSLLRQRRPSMKQRASFYRMVAGHIDRGYAIKFVLTRLHSIFLTRKPRDVRTRMLGDLIAQMEGGRSFSAALARWVPANEAMMVRMGERQGDRDRLVLALRNTARTAESIRDIIRSTAAKLFMPGLLLVVGIGFVFGASYNMLPTFAEFRDPENWDELGQTVWAVASFVRDWDVVIAAVVVGLIGFLYWSLPNQVGPVREKLDRIPPYTIYRAIQSAGFLVACSGMVRSGTPVYQAISELYDRSSRYGRYYLRQTLKRLRDGDGPGRALNTAFFLPETRIQIEVFEDTPDFSPVLDQLGEEVIEDTAEALGLQARILSIVILIFIAVVVLSLALTMFSVTERPPMAGF